VEHCSKAASIHVRNILKIAASRADSAMQIAVAADAKTGRLSVQTMSLVGKKWM
jgi:hypothetical protein